MAAYSFELDIVAVEDLVLPVGADEAADEGENEHHGEDRQTHDREAVAEKALGDQRARGKDLDAAVVVEESCSGEPLSC